MKVAEAHLALTDLLDRLADLLEYPNGDFHHLTGSSREALNRIASSTACESFDRFEEAVSGRSREELEELFTTTFDLNPVSTLELGWHLFGESYDRGIFLVRMREELDRLGVKESQELPDHLTVLLQAAGRMPSDRRRLFIINCLLPGLDKIREKLEEEEENVFAPLIRTLDAVLRDAARRASGETP